MPASDGGGPHAFLSAAAFLFDDEGRVLLVRENYDRMRYGPPGGMVEPGESPQAAVVREVLEETGLTVRVDYLVGVCYGGIDREFVGFAFRCSITGGEPVLPDTGEIADVDWFDSSAPPEPLTVLGRVFLSDAAAGRRGLFHP